MARMIPLAASDDTVQGEKDVFNMLARGPEDWTVFHSLDLAPWNRDKRTEIDFVVVIPDAGILCIEVKSHQKISFHDDRWHPATISKNPFKQAADGCYTLHRALKELAPYVADIPFAHCCIFPNADFDVGRVVSVRRDELMDRSVFRGFPSAAEFCADIRRRMIDLSVADYRRPLSAPIPPLRVDSLISLCVPVQKHRPGAAEQIKKRHLEVDLLLRAQQTPVLQLARHNERLLVTGGAGTGKTLIAMELAKRFAENGNRVALISFNRMIGSWMREQVSMGGGYPTLVADSVNALLVRMFNIEVPSNAGDEFWSTVPAIVEERLTDPGTKSETYFDYLVVDEAQDILARPAIWNCLLELLDGGLSNGRFALFGDVEHQVLRAHDKLRTTIDELKRDASVACWHLDENCRNTPAVGQAALLLSGIPQSLYSGYLRGGGSVDDVALKIFESDEQEKSLIRQILTEVKQRGYRPSETTLLSFCSADTSVSRQMVKQGMNMQQAQKADRQVGYASVHEFKGMENKVIIVTDINLNMDAYSRSLFFTALTRSTALVRVVCSSSDAPTLKRWIVEGDA